MRALTLSLALLLTAGCRDPSAGPPPRHLDPVQQDRVEALTFAEAPRPARPVPGEGVELGGGKVRFLGADVVPDPVVRGGSVTLTLYWTAQRPIAEDWKVFVHGQGAGTGVVINADHPPVEGLWPTSRWEPGRTYADPVRFEVPEGYPHEALELWVGLFRYEDRMPVARRGSDGKHRIRVATLPVAGGALPVPTYEAPRARTPPVIDGRLDEALWREAPLALLSRSSGRGAPQHRTEARMAWDDDHLYVAFRAEDDDVWSTFQRDDDPLYEQEVVEVFVDANGDGRSYNELQVAPSGRIFDAHFDGPRQGMDLGWSSGMRAAVQVEGTLNDDSDRDRGWTAELAIPIARLSAVPNLPPRAGEVWRVNLFRLEHPGRKRVEGQALSPPVVPDFHRPERFARVVLTDAEEAPEDAAHP